MIEEKIAVFTRYFTDQIAQCNAHEEELRKDDRKDEAIFQKVKANVFDIFRTVFAVAVQNCPANPDEIRRFFMLRMDQIPGSWESALNHAREHQEIEKALIEEIKLDTVAQIRKEFSRIWEDVQ